MTKYKSLLWQIVSSLIGLVVFLIALLVVNILTNYIESPILNQVVSFLNSNILIIILIAVFFIIGEVFWALTFPFNLPSPFFNAISAVFIAVFILRVIDFVIKLLTNQNVSGIISMVSYFLYPLVFLIVLVVGFVDIFSKLGRKEGKRKKR